MKNVLFLCLLIGCIASCKKDEVSKDCSPADFVGTYTGQETCGSDVTSAAYTITESNNGLVLKDSDDNEFNITTNDCQITIPKLDLFFAEFSGDGSLNGDQLTVNLDIDVIGISSKCTFKGTK